MSTNWPMLSSPSLTDPFGGLTTALHNGMDRAYYFYATSPRMAVSLIIFFLFLIYYLREVVKKPEFFCREGKFKWFILANVTQLHSRYWPTFWCFGTHGQTAIANAIRNTLPNLKYLREYICLGDGGQVSLDWYEDKDTTHPDSPTKPIALFIPGLTGDSQTEYIKSLIPHAQQCGFRCVGFNNRGRGGMKILTPKLYCAANCDDLAAAIDVIKRKYPKARLAATGVSLGGILLSRYLIERGERSLVDCALLISVCWDFSAGCESMERTGLNMVLNQHLAKSLVQLALEHRKMIEPLGIVNFDEVQQSKTLQEFDDRFTIRMWGYRSTKEYYDDASNKGKIDRIKVPTLCITAADDMFAPVESLPVEEIAQSSHVAMIVTQRGGHIGFMEGLLPLLPFYSERLCRQWFAALAKLQDIRHELC